MDPSIQKIFYFTLKTEALVPVRVHGPLGRPPLAWPGTLYYGNFYTQQTIFGAPGVFVIAKPTCTFVCFNYFSKCRNNILFNFESNITVHLGAIRASKETQHPCNQPLELQLPSRKIGPGLRTVSEILFWPKSRIGHPEKFLFILLSKNIFTGSKYPKSILLHFEKRNTEQYWLSSLYTVQGVNKRAYSFKVMTGWYHWYKRLGWILETLYATRFWVRLIYTSFVIDIETESTPPSILMCFSPNAVSFAAHKKMLLSVKRCPSSLTYAAIQVPGRSQSTRWSTWFRDRD